MRRHTSRSGKAAFAILPAILFVALALGVAHAADQITLTGGTCSGQGQSQAASYPLAAFGLTNANDQDCESYMLGSLGLDTSQTARTCMSPTWFPAPGGKLCIFPWDMLSVTSSHNVCMANPPYTCSGLKLTSDAQ